MLTVTIWSITLTWRAVLYKRAMQAGMVSFIANRRSRSEGRLACRPEWGIVNSCACVVPVKGLLRDKGCIICIMQHPGTMLPGNFAFAFRIVQGIAILTHGRQVLFQD